MRPAQPSPARPLSAHTSPGAAVPGRGMLSAERFFSARGCLQRGSHRGRRPLRVAAAQSRGHPGRPCVVNSASPGAQCRSCQSGRCAAYGPVGTYASAWGLSGEAWLEKRLLHLPSVVLSLCARPGKSGEADGPFLRLTCWWLQLLQV